MVNHSALRFWSLVFWFYWFGFLLSNYEFFKQFECLVLLLVGALVYYTEIDKVDNVRFVFDVLVTEYIFMHNNDVKDGSLPYFLFLLIPRYRMVFHDFWRILRSQPCFFIIIIKWILNLKWFC